MSDSGTDFIAVDDGTTVRDSGEYDDLVELLEEIVAESKFMKDKHSGPATPQASEPLGGNMTDHWLQPDPNFILEQVKKMRVPLSCRVCNQKGEPADFVLCGGCGAARLPAHRQCLLLTAFHQPGEDEENIYGSPCEEVDFQEFVYTSWLMDSKLRSKDQVALHLEDVWSTWLGMPDGQDGPHPQIHVFPRLESLMTEVTNRPPRQYPSLVSIIGDTGSGKSTLIAAMIRMLAPTAHGQHRVPVPGDETNNFDSTSSDVHIFADPKTIHTENPCFFVDCEGFSGTDKPISRQLLSEAQQTQASQVSTDGVIKKPNTLKVIAEHANSVSDRIDLKWGRLFTIVSESPYLSRKGNGIVDPDTRKIVVKSLYPRLLYSFSDVVCFVTNNSRSSHNILQDMFKWAKEGHEKTLNQRIRPGLIIVLNKMTDGSHNALADVGEATQRLLSNFQQSNRFADLQRKWRSRGMEIKSAQELILCYYDSFRVISIPQYTASSPATVKKTSDQIKSLYDEIYKMSELIRKKRQFLNMELDIASFNAYLKQSLVNLGRDYHSTIDFHQLSYADSSLPRRFSEHLIYVMSNVGKDRNFNTSEAVGGELHLVSQITPYIAACIVAQINSSESQDEIQKRKNDLVDEARRGLEAFRAKFWRCEQKDSLGQRRCKNYWLSHEKGHQFEERQGESDDTLAVGSFKSSYDPEAFAENLWKEVTRLHSRRDAIDQLASAAGSCGVASITGQRTCLACLSNTPTNMLPCRPKQHCICEDCIRRYNQDQTGVSIIHITSCPLGCSLTITPWTIRVKPPTAGARILSLDGGGIRGIAELAILSELEREVGCGLRIQELFDLVVGTSTGGIVALGVFEKNWPLVDAESTFKELVRTAFSKKLLLKLPFLSKVTKYFLSVKYKTEGIDSSLQSAFGEGYLFGQADSVNLGDAVKVAVVTCIEGRNQPTLIANYTRNPLDKLRGGREVYDCLQRAHDQSADFQVWQAARATSAAHTFFKPYQHTPTQMSYVDGAIVRNNPVRLAYGEANRIWKSGARPDIVVSLGTGIQIDDKSRIVDATDKTLENMINRLPKKFATIAKVALDMVQATIDCNREWVDFKSSIRGELARNCHRLDIGLKDEKPPSIDEVGRTDYMWSKSQQYFRQPRPSYIRPDPYIQPEYPSGREHLRVIARRLLAALFYLSNLLGSNMPAGPFKTNLCCRLPPQSDGALNILANRPNFRLKEVDANGEKIFHPVRALLPGMLDENTLLGPVELDISGGEYTRTVEVQFPRRSSDWEPIGGF